MKSKEDYKPKTIEQYQKEIIGYLSKPVEPYSQDRNVSPAHGIAMKTNNYGFDFPDFLDALEDLVAKGIVEMKPSTGLTGHERYKMAGANSHRDEYGRLK